MWAKPWTGFVFAFFGWRHGTGIFRARISGIGRWLRFLCIGWCRRIGFVPLAFNV
jgi:hypothetical protein